MASKPGILTDWPWKPLGSFKYGLLAPWVVHSIYSCMVKGEEEKDLFSLLIIPFLLSRMLHNQIWNTLSRHRSAKGNNLVLDKGIEFDQMDRENDWDDQIILNGILYYFFNVTHVGASRLPLWRTDGVIIMILLHMGPVEYIYYWFHRALHHHYLFSRYHSHHHSSIVNQPISAVIQPFAEVSVYIMLFAIPIYTLIQTGTASMAALFGYVTYIDFMNSMGHCNFEMIPRWIFTLFPFLKYLMYTSSFHSLHHTQIQTNYSLFVPLYDYIYGTRNKSTDLVYETSLEKKEPTANVVHLTHLTTFNSIFQLPIGFGSLASKPLEHNWYIWMMWPFTCLLFIFTWFFGSTFITSSHTLEKLKLQTWVLPKYIIHFSSKWQREKINTLIEEAITDAHNKGVKVLSLGLLNQQDEDFNKIGEIYIKRNPKLKLKVVDGSSLAVAVVLNTIPKQTTHVLFRGQISKTARALIFALCQRGIQVNMLYEDDYKKLKINNASANATDLVLTESCQHQVWLVDEGLRKEEQLKASKGTLFIPFSQFPPKKLRKDCYYLTTPALMAPPSLRNMHTCENWLPRRAMSAWRVAGIIHALEEWNVNECGNDMFGIDKVWEACLRHGFQPLSPINTSS